LQRLGLGTSPNEAFSPRFLVYGVGGTNIVDNIVKVMSMLDSVDPERRGFSEVFSSGGMSVFGVAEADASYGVEEAVKVALSSPLINARHHDVREALVHIWGPRYVSPEETVRITQLICEAVGTNVPIICNFAGVSDMGKVMRVMVLLTGVGLPIFFPHHEGELTDLFNLEPGVGSEQALGIDLDVTQLDDV